MRELNYFKSFYENFFIILAICAYALYLEPCALNLVSLISQLLISYFCIMKFQIGDRVTVLHSNEEGEVIDVINDKMVMVDVRGVKFPVYIDQLDFPYFKRFTEKKNLPLKKAKTFVDQVPVDKSPKKNNPLDGCWLSILPVSDTD